MSDASGVVGPLVASFTPAELAEAVGGTLLHAGACVAMGTVCTDSRALGAGQTFWAVAGDRFDGHDFVTQAIALGAAGVVVARSRGPVEAGNAFVVEVDDTVRALGLLAAAVLRRRRAAGDGFRVYAITGSNGKTTTKEMLASALATRYAVHKTSGNFNNWIGLPLTVFGLSASHQVAVLEMGANAPGEIRWMREVARPDVCLLTSVAAAHLQGFGSLEGVARAKGEIFEGDEATRFVMPASCRDRFGFLNGDPRVVTVGPSGVQPAPDVRLEDLSSGARGVRATYRWGAGAATVEVPLLGEHNAHNFGLVVAAVAPLALTVEELQAGASALKLPPGRLETHRYADGIEVLQDAYNANPGSMRAALAVLAARAEASHRVAVLGEMRELGPTSSQLHEALGADAARLPVRVLIFVGGEDAQSLSAGARGAGASRVHCFGLDEVEAVAELLQQTLQAGDVVLLKGSRAVALERVAARLRAQRAES